MSENPSAFPVGTVVALANPGMTLRDYFAGQMLIGLSLKDPWADPMMLASWAYNAADALLAARTGDQS